MTLGLAIIVIIQLLLLIVYLYANKFSSLANPLHYIIVFLTISVVGYSIFKNEILNFGWRNVQIITDVAIVNILTQYVFLTFVLVFIDVLAKLALSSGRKYGHQSISGKSLVIATSISSLHIKLIAAFSYLSFLTFLLVYLAVGGLDDVFSANVSEKYSGGNFVWLTYGVYFLSVGSAILILHQRLFGKVVNHLFLVTGVAILFLLLIGLKTRFLAVSMILTCLISYWIKNRRVLNDVSLRQVIGFGFFIMLVSGFAILRPVIFSIQHADHFVLDAGTFGGAISESWKLVIASSDFFHPVSTAVEMTNGHLYDADVGAFFDSLSVLLPSFLRADGVMSEAARFAYFYYPELYAVGGGTGFSFLGSSVSYFGAYVGPFIAGVCLWLLCKILSRSANRLPFEPNVVALAFLACPLNIIFIERIGIVASLKQLSFTFLVILLIFFAAKVFANMLMASIGVKSGSRSSVYV